MADLHETIMEYENIIKDVKKTQEEYNLSFAESLEIIKLKQIGKLSDNIEELTRALWES